MDVQEILGDLYTDEIKAKIGDTKLIIDDGTFVSKADYLPRKVYNEDKAKLTQQLSDRTKELDGLKDKLKDSEGAAKIIDELQAKQKADDEVHKTALKLSRVTAAVEIALIKAQAIHPNLVKGLIKMDQITALEDGTFHGIDAQIEALKTGDYKDQFGEVRVSGAPPGDSDPPAKKTKIDELEKQYEQVVKNFGMASPQAIAVKNQLWIARTKKE